MNSQVTESAPKSLSVAHLFLSLVHQAQIVLLVVLLAAIANYFIGSVMPTEDKEPNGFFGYHSQSALHWRSFCDLISQKRSNRCLQY